MRNWRSEEARPLSDIPVTGLEIFIAMERNDSISALAPFNLEIYRLGVVSLCFEGKRSFLLFQASSNNEKCL